MWTKEWPTKVGWFWFYGWKYGKDDYHPDPELCVVRTYMAANGLMHTIDGQFMYRSEGHDGVFQEMILPVLPLEREEKDAS